MMDFSADTLEILDVDYETYFTYLETNSGERYFIFIYPISETEVTVHLVDKQEPVSRLDNNDNKNITLFYMHLSSGNNKSWYPGYSGDFKQWANQYYKTVDNGIRPRIFIEYFFSYVRESNITEEQKEDLKGVGKIMMAKILTDPVVLRLLDAKDVDEVGLEAVPSNNYINIADNRRRLANYYRQYGFDYVYDAFRPNTEITAENLPGRGKKDEPLINILTHVPMKMRLADMEMYAQALRENAWIDLTQEEEEEEKLLERPIIDLTLSEEEKYDYMKEDQFNPFEDTPIPEYTIGAESREIEEDSESEELPSLYQLMQFEPLEF